MDHGGCLSLTFSFNLIKLQQTRFSHRIGKSIQLKVSGPLKLMEVDVQFHLIREHKPKKDSKMNIYSHKVMIDGSTIPNLE